MAAPQLENGYARIANELIEQFVARNFGKRELVVLLYVVRQTYGFNRKTFALSVSEAAKAIGLEAENLRKAIKGLVTAGVLSSDESGVGIQKDHDRWQVPSHGSVKSTGKPSGQINRKNRSNQPEKPVKSTGETPLEVAVAALLQEPKDRKTKDNPCSPQGDVLGLPTALEGGDGPRYTPEFLVFWEAYPDNDKALRPNFGRKEAKAKCFENWQRRKLTPLQVGRLMQALEIDKASAKWNEQGGKFINAPLVWLNKKRWLDELPALAAVVPANDAFRAYYLGGKENWTDAHVVSFWVGKINHDLEAALDEEGLLAMLATDGLMPTLRQVDRLGREAQERKQVRHA